MMPRESRTPPEEEDSIYVPIDAPLLARGPVSGDELWTSTATSSRRLPPRKTSSLWPCQRQGQRPQLPTLEETEEQARICRRAAFAHAAEADDTERHVNDERDDLIAIESAFDACDTDRSGLISHEELHAVLLALGADITLQDAQQMATAAVDAAAARPDHHHQQQQQQRRRPPQQPMDRAHTPLSFHALKPFEEGIRQVTRAAARVTAELQAEAELATASVRRQWCERGSTGNATDEPKSGAQMQLDLNGFRQLMTGPDLARFILPVGSGGSWRQRVAHVCELRRAFDVADVNGDNSIRHSELETVLLALAPFTRAAHSGDHTSLLLVAQRQQGAARSALSGDVELVWRALNPTAAEAISWSEFLAGVAAVRQQAIPLSSSSSPPLSSQQQQEAAIRCMELLDLAAPSSFSSTTTAATACGGPSAELVSLLVDIPVRYTPSIILRCVCIYLVISNYARMIFICILFARTSDYLHRHP